MAQLTNHQLIEYSFDRHIRYERKNCVDQDGHQVDGLYADWIILDNPKVYNAYNIEMLKDLYFAFHRASQSRDTVAVVLTAVGDRAFCTGGDLKHYTQDYLNRPEEFKHYLRLFTDVISAILLCDKPVINRVNGVRVGGGQEIGMACDLTIASDMANFAQAGTKHGSAPIVGVSDFLPLYVGIERATRACVLAEMWTAYQAQEIGLISACVPVVKHQGDYIPNPLVETSKDQHNFGQLKMGEELSQSKKILKESEIDLSLLDEQVNKEILSFLYSYPGCLTTTLESLRQHKRERFERNKVANRSWVALNAMTEAQVGFRSFVQGTKDNRQGNFIELRQKLAQGCQWSEDFVEQFLPTSPEIKK